MSRHSLYFDLLDAFREPGCALCRLATRSAARFLDVLSYENVNDYEVREWLRQARGFCTVHAWQWVDDVRDGLGTAIIYRDILHAVQADTRTVAGLFSGLPAMPAAMAAQRLGARLGRWLRHPLAELAHTIAGGPPALPATTPPARFLLPAGVCPACHALQQSERIYLETLLEHIHEREFHERYAASVGLCLPHLLRALVQARGRTCEALVEPVGAQWDRVAQKATAAAPADLSAALALRVLAGERGLTARSVLPWQQHYAAWRLVETAGEPSDACMAVQEAAGADPLDVACPICHAALEGLAHYLDRLLAELHRAGLRYAPASALARSGTGSFGEEPVQAATFSLEGTDPSVSLPPAGTDEWVSSRGLCALHAWSLVQRLLETGEDAAPAGRLAAPVLAALRRRLRDTLRTAQGRPDGRVLARALAPETPCPACRARALAESRATLALVTRLNTDGRADAADAAGRPGSGAILCLGHLALALEVAWRQGARAAARRIIAQQQRFYGVLEWHLSEYIRKQDDRFRDEPRGIEQRAPWVALQLIAGARAVR
jgi:hypothetical protein